MKKVVTCVLFSGLAAIALSGCSELQSLLSEGLQDTGIDAIHGTIMGDEDLIIGDALPISSTSFDLSDPAFEDELQYIDDEDVGSDPAFELDAAEALFSDDDLAILEAFDPSATDTQANRLLVTMASETILGSSSIAYFHVPNQGADFAIPVRQDLLGYWILDRIVLDHAYLDGGNADFLTKVGASVTLILFDGIGGIAELRTPSANADLNALELAIFGSLQRSSGVVLVGAIREIPLVAKCVSKGGPAHRCVLIPNTATGEYRIPIRIPSPKLGAVEAILREGEPDNGLAMFIDFGSDVPAGANRLGEPIPVRMDERLGTFRFDWRVEEFTYLDEE